MAKLKLIPIVEIEPYRFSDRSAPEGGVEPHGPVTRVEWDSYLEACFRDAGFDGLRPLREGSMMVPVDELKACHIRTLMEKEMEDLGATTPNEYVFRSTVDTPTFEGGLAIEIDGDIVSEPGCCCDLSEWLEWHEIWNGHDATSVQLKYQPDTDTFGIRVGPWESGEWDMVCAVGCGELRACGESVQSAFENFASTLESLVPEIVPDYKRHSFAAQMVGLEEITHGSE